MHLYLSSYGIGDKGEDLVQMVGNNKRVAIIMNAGDLDAAYHDTGLQKQMTSLSALGFIPEELDLRDYFPDNSGLREKVLEFGLVWVRGGNVFVLKRAFEQSGFGGIISDLIKSNSLVYGGYSAGALVVTPTLRGVELVDDPGPVPEGYKKDFSWDGLALVDYSIAPHYKSEHPETEAIEKVVQYFEKNAMPFKTLRDGEVIVVDTD